MGKLIFHIEALIDRSVGLASAATYWGAAVCAAMGIGRGRYGNLWAAILLRGVLPGRSPRSPQAAGGRGAPGGLNLETIACTRRRQARRGDGRLTIPTPNPCVANPPPRADEPLVGGLKARCNILDTKQS